MNSDLSILAKSTQNLARNPLGIIALFLLLVYGIASLVTATSNIDSFSREVLVWFLVLFPVIVLVLFYKLVTGHHDKLYAPMDFRDDNLFIKAMELSLKRTESRDLPERVIEEVSRSLSKDEDSDKVKQGMTKAVIKSLVLPYGSLTVKVLYYSLEKRVAVRFNKEDNIALLYFDGKQMGGYSKESFFRDFVDLHNRGIITISSTEPFDFSVVDFARLAIKELYEES